MATRKRPFLWERAFRRVSQLSALFAQHYARRTYEGEHGGSYDGSVAGLRSCEAVIPAYAEGSPVVLAGYAVAVAGAYVAAAPMAAGVVVVAGVIVPVGTAAVIRPRVGIGLAVKFHGRGICIVAAAVYAVSYYACRFGFAMSAVASAGKSRLCGGQSVPAPSGSAIAVTEGGDFYIFEFGLTF